MSSYELPIIPDHNLYDKAVPPDRDRSRSPLRNRQGRVTAESNNERPGTSRHGRGGGQRQENDFIGESDSEIQGETQETDNSQELSQRERNRLRVAR